VGLLPATFVGTAIIAFGLHKKMIEKIEEEDKSLD
jgi:hypothetical protein